MYLDDQPITTIQGAIDIHVYGIERVEATGEMGPPRRGLHGTRSFATFHGCISNSRTPLPGCVSTPEQGAPDFNSVDTHGARAMLNRDDAHLQAAVVYVGTREHPLTRGNRADVDDLPAYTLVDLSTGLDRGVYSIDLYINNVFDAARHNETGQACGSCERQYYLPNPPRTIGLKFSQEF